MRTITLCFSLLLCTHLTFSQSNIRVNQKDYKVKIKKANSPIQLDGYLNEPAWKTADVADDFWQKTPRNDVKAERKTVASLTYDGDYLYVGITCFDSTNHVITTLKRDVGFWDSDGVAVVIDPLNEATAGFMFATNPYGVQTEVLLGGGSGFENYNGNWDNRWYVEAQRFDDRWTVEMAIPFKTLRYETDNTTWGINFIRNNRKSNLQDVWAPVPLQFWMIDLGYAGLLEWDQAPAKVKSNINIIPYINTSTFQDNENDEPTDYNFNAGLDAKIALSPALNLDLTINPDFSQVEVDQQVTNLTRFSIFLPERRTFFLENSDIFTRVGFPFGRPFFSRRIGLDEDGNAVPINFGARLTGNVTNTTRIGILNAQTGAVQEGTFGQNYTAAAFSQRVLKRSRITGLFVNRQGAMADGGLSASDYGRNASLQFNYLNEDGTFEFWSGGHRSYKRGINAENNFFENGFAYTGTNLELVVSHVYMGTNYFADVGFVNLIENYDAIRDTTIRLGYNLLFFPITYTFFPKSTSFINEHSINIETLVNLDPQGKFVERNTDFVYRFQFKNTSSLRLGLQDNLVDLRFPFSFTDGEPLPAQRYRYYQSSLSYSTDERKLFQIQMDMSTGSFYNGNLNSVNLGFSYRRQPWGNFGLAIEYNRLSFPDLFGSTTLWAFSPRIEFNFNRNLFWTTFLQYNTQLDNFNINSRLQWRFAPMSDVFLVYTDNYAIENFGQKNRAIVLKVNYWMVL